jgi:hypothetical protein
MHWLDRLAGTVMVRTRTRLFPDGWGDLTIVRRPPVAIDVAWSRPERMGILDGTFTSPADLPGPARTGHVRWFNAANSEEIVVLFASSNDEGYRQRSRIARLLARAGVGSILLENPFYGRRRVHPGEPAVRTVAEFLTMGAAAIAEGIGLLMGLHAPRRGVAGYSMGGNIAGLVAALFPDEIVTTLMAPSPSPAPVFTDGLLSHVVDWPSLGGSREQLREVLGRVSILSLPAPARPDLATIVAPTGDGYIPRPSVDAIHTHWPGSELRWESGGHVSLAAFGTRRLAQAVLDGFERFSRPV